MVKPSHPVRNTETHGSRAKTFKVTPDNTTQGETKRCSHFGIQTSPQY